MSYFITKEEHWGDAEHWDWVLMQGNGGDSTFGDNLFIARYVCRTRKPAISAF